MVFLTFVHIVLFRCGKFGHHFSAKSSKTIANTIFYCVPDCLIMKGWNANDNMQQVFNMVDNIVMFPYKHHQILLRFHMDIFRINEERD